MAFAPRGSAPPVHYHTVKSYLLRVHRGPKERGTAFVDDYDWRTLSVTDVNSLPQLMKEIESRLGLRTTTRELLRRDLVRHVWSPVYTLTDLK
eukprot:COSAG03_NODE_12203_length_556_cov_0.735808_2_plen_92_part_01